MAYNVKFAQGLAANYAALATKDSNTFYVTTDDKELYLGDKKLTSQKEVTEAVASIGTLANLSTTDQTSLVAALNEVIASLADVATSGDAADVEVADADGYFTAATKTVESVLAEIGKSLSDNATTAAITIDTSTTTTGALKSYTVKQGSTTVGVIDIPKDYLVKSAEVKECTTADDPVSGYQVGDKYIDFVVNSTDGNGNESHVYLLVEELVDVYTAEASAAQVQLTISSTNEISAEIVDGSVDEAALAADAVTAAKIKDGEVTKAKLASAVQTSLDAADNATPVGDSTADTKDTVSYYGIKAYVDDKVGSGVSDLDATVKTPDIATAGTGLQITVVETDGLLTSVTLTGDYSETYDAKGAADAVLGTATDTATANTVYGAKAYTDAALTWETF